MFFGFLLLWKCAVFFLFGGRYCTPNRRHYPLCVSGEWEEYAYLSLCAFKCFFIVFFFRLTVCLMFVFILIPSSIFFLQSDGEESDEDEDEDKEAEREDMDEDEDEDEDEGLDRVDTVMRDSLRLKKEFEEMQRQEVCLFVCVSVRECVRVRVRV